MKRSPQTNLVSGLYLALNCKNYVRKCNALKIMVNARDTNLNSEYLVTILSTIAIIPLPSDQTIDATWYSDDKFFVMSKSRTYICRLQISREWWQKLQTSLLISVNLQNFEIEMWCLHSLTSGLISTFLLSISYRMCLASGIPDRYVSTHRRVDIFRLSEVTLLNCIANRREHRFMKECENWL